MRQDEYLTDVDEFILGHPEMDREAACQAFLEAALNLPPDARWEAIYPGFSTGFGTRYSAVQRALRRLPVYEAVRPAEKDAPAAEPAQPGLNRRQSHNESRVWVPTAHTWLPLTTVTRAQWCDCIAFYQARIAGYATSIAEITGYIKQIDSVPGANCLADVYATHAA